MANLQDEIETILRSVNKAEHFINIAKIKLNGLCRDVEKSGDSVLAPQSGLPQETQRKLASKLRKPRKVS